MSVRDALVYPFTKLYDRCIPNVGVDVRVGVGPVEFQLNSTRQRQPVTLLNANGT